MKKLICAVLTVLLFLCNQSNASEKIKIIENLRKINSLQFNFTQLSSDGQENGSCILIYPKKMRCIYDDQKKEIIVNDDYLYLINKEENKNDAPIELFWIYFPASRDVLHAAKAFNERNSAMPFTFDHLLNSRRFNAVIYLEENVYGDREIKDYMKENSQMQLLESERVKEKIRNFELDMWNY